LLNLPFTVLDSNSKSSLGEVVVAATKSPESVESTGKCVVSSSDETSVGSSGFCNKKISKKAEP